MMESSKCVAVQRENGWCEFYHKRIEVVPELRKEIIDLRVEFAGGDIVIESKGVREDFSRN